MTAYDSLYEFSEYGMDVFKQTFEGKLEEETINSIDPTVASPVAGTRAFTVADWRTSKEMAEAIIEACGADRVSNLLGRPQLWAWLSFILRDQVYPRLKTGQRKLGEVHRWYPSDVDDYQKGQRHLVRMPVLLLHSFGSDSDHLLRGPPSVPGEIREQLTSQQDLFHRTIQAAACKLYFDPTSGKLRKGAGGKGAGSARRFAQVRKQLDVTWDLFALSPDQLIAKLPGEFDRFKVQALES